MNKNSKQVAEFLEWYYEATCKKGYYYTPGEFNDQMDTLKKAGWSGSPRVLSWKYLQYL